MDERLQALIEALADDETREEGLAELDDEVLDATRGELHALFKAIRAGEVEDTPADDVAVLQSLHDAITVLDGEKDRRAVLAAETAETIAALETSLEDPPADDPETGEAEVEEAAEETEEADEKVEEPVMAAVEEPAPKKTRRASLARLAAQVPEAAKPQAPAVTKPRWQTLDGTVVTEELDIARRFIAAIDSIAGTDSPPGFAQKIPVIRLKTELPETHHIGAGDSLEAIQPKLDAVTAAARHPEDWTDEQRAIVASGGWCAPAEPRYTIPSVVTAARPFRDGLARITSSRGTIHFVRAARLRTILANTTSAAVTTWENTTDETPGESTKTRQTHACRTIQEEELGAVVARMRFGNFQQRAFPEDVAHDLELVAARHARVAEVRLLDALIADMAVDVAMTGLVGTARDVKHHFAQAASEMRYTERSTQTIRCAVSDVLLDMMYSDLALQQPGDDALLYSRAYSDQILNSVYGLAHTTVLDVPTGADAFVTNSDGENLADFPDDVEVPFWFDGTAIFVDGGSLDLGIIRDSTLNQTNDYEIFYETFEGLIWTGPYGKTLTLTTCPNGESQVATDETGGLCSGS